MRVAITFMIMSFCLHAESKLNIHKEAMIKGANGKMKVGQIKLKQLRKKYFGAPPVQSGWDGSYSEVKKFLKDNANDPSSISIEGCSSVGVDDKQGWVVGCTYFGNNAFGGKIKKSNWFIIKNGVVTKMYPANEYKN